MAWIRIPDRYNEMQMLINLDNVVAAHYVPFGGDEVLEIETISGHGIPTSLSLNEFSAICGCSQVERI